MFIRNAWYAAALSSELSSGLFARTIVNEQVVMYRTPDGRIAALEDRCAHRQVPLSKGRLLGDQIECWYHGLRYDSSGQCVLVPSQKAVPPRACVKAFPAVEKYGLIWLWMGERERLDEALIPNHWVCSSPDLAGEMQYCPINCDYLFGIDNILDISHAAFVHGKTLASQDVVHTEPTVEIKENEVRVRRVLRNEKTPPLYNQIMRLESIDRVQEVIFWPIGNTRVETVAHPSGQPDGQTLRVYTTTIFTPATETMSHIFVGMHRDFAVNNPQLTEVITREVYSTVLEDKAVTESLQGNWRPDAPMTQIKVDQPAIAARRMLDRLLKMDSPTEKQP